MITQTTEEVSYVDANGNIAYRIVVIFRGDEAANNIVGTDTTDVLCGWDGTDTLIGGFSSDALFGGNDNDLIVQDGQQDDAGDAIDGGDGIDTLDYSGMEDVHGGLAGITVDLPGMTVTKFRDRFYMQTDNVQNVEKFLGSRFDDRMIGDAANNYFEGYGGEDTLEGGAGNDSLEGGAGNDLLRGGTGNDMFLVTPSSYADSDIIDGGDGNDILGFYQLDGGVNLDLAVGTLRRYQGNAIVGIDTVLSIENAVGTGFNDTLSGSAIAELLNGSCGNDVLSGAEGADTLGGGIGNDTLTGGAGNDRIVGEDGDDMIIQSADSFTDNDSLTGSAGFDTLDYSNIAGAGMRIEVDFGTGTVRKYQDERLVGTDKILDIEKVIGSQGHDKFIGNASDNYFEGAAGNDTFIGGAGRDTLFGGDGDDRFLASNWAGNATIDGGNGTNTLDYSALPAITGKSPSINVNLSLHTVTKVSLIVSTDIVFDVKAIIGSGFNDVMNGDSLANVFDAGAGNDTLSGGVGNDAMAGGAGDDLVYQNANVLDRDTLYGGEGQDQLSYRDFMGKIYVNLLDGTVRKSQEMFVSMDYIFDFEDIAGSAYADTLIGSHDDNTLRGGAGDDTINALAGDDNLQGDDGNDYLIGSNGSDFLDGGNGDDVLEGGEDNDILHGGTGNDTLSGGAGTNVLQGGDGDDVLIKDQFSSGGVLDGGEGVDRIDYSAFDSASLAIKANLAVGTIQRYQDNRLVGTDTISNMEGVIGTEGNDSLTGSKSDDFLDGRAGGDFIRGGEGNDTIAGDEGDDRILQDVWRDSDTLDGGAGHDLLDYSVMPVVAGVVTSITVDADEGKVWKYHDGVVVGTDVFSHIEVILASRFDDDLKGDASANQISGGAGNDTLHGRDGDDVLYGGAGNDDLFGGSGNDSMTALDGNDNVKQASSSLHDNDTIDGGTGIDVLDYADLDIYLHIPVSINVSLADGTVRKYLEGELVGQDTLRNFEIIGGTDFNDTLTGSADPDVLWGGFGDDILTGGGDSDYLRGQAGDDRLSGQSGNDKLDGADGNDTLSGGEGSDNIFAGSGDDTFVQDVDFGHDQLDGGDGFDTVDYSRALVSKGGLTINLAAGTVEKFQQILVVQTDTLKNIEAIIGSIFSDKISGSSNADVLSGNSGNDTLSGGDGNDSLDGGAGNDVIYGGAGDDRIVQSGYIGNDKINGGAGLDTLDYSQFQWTAGTTFGVKVDLIQGKIEKQQSGQTVGTDTVVAVENIVGTRYADKMTGGKSDSILDGSDGDDMIDGGAGNDVVLGGAGRDYLSGEAGDDTVNGGAGNDVIRDRSGNDVFVYDRGFGQDELMNINPEDSAHVDIVQFNGINASDILFRRESAYDLGISIAGTTDSLSIDFWYGAPGDEKGESTQIYKVDQFRVGYQALSARFVDYYVTTIGAAPVSMATLIGLETATHNPIQ